MKIFPSFLAKVEKIYTALLGRIRVSCKSERIRVGMLSKIFFHLIRDSSGSSISSYHYRVVRKEKKLDKLIKKQKMALIEFEKTQVLLKRSLYDLIVKISQISEELNTSNRQIKDPFAIYDELMVKLSKEEKDENKD